MRTRWRGGAPCGEASRTPLPDQPCLLLKVSGRRAAECAGRSTLALCWCLTSAGDSPRPSPPSPSVRHLNVARQSPSWLLWYTQRQLRGRARAGFIATISTHPLAADIILEQPTALPPPGEGMVLHYSEPRSLPARNWLVGAA